MNGHWIHQAILYFTSSSLKNGEAYKKYKRDRKADEKKKEKKIAVIKSKMTSHSIYHKKLPPFLFPALRNKTDELKTRKEMKDTKHTQREKEKNTSP